MIENIVFYLVFVSQLALISVYFPTRILSRVREVIKRYPPEEYPRLYPRPMEDEYRGQQNFRLLNRGAFIIGVVLLGFIIEWEIRLDGPQEYSVALPAFFGLIQFIPYVLLEISGFRQFKLMRQADTRTLRFAELQPRKLFDYISPAWVIATVGLYIGYVIVDVTGMYLSMWETSDTVIRLMTSGLCNLLFGAVIYWNLHGRKPDPYQASKDRYCNIRNVIKVQLLISMAVSVFFAISGLLNYLQWEMMEVIATSIYFQAIAVAGFGSMLNGVKIEHVDFNVYKGEAKSSGA